MLPEGGSQRVSRLLGDIANLRRGLGPYVKFDRKYKKTPRLAKTIPRKKGSTAEKTRMRKCRGHCEQQRNCWSKRVARKRNEKHLKVLVDVDCCLLNQPSKSREGQHLGQPGVMGGCDKRNQGMRGTHVSALLLKSARGIKQAKSSRRTCRAFLYS